MKTRTFKLAFYRIDKTTDIFSKLTGFWTNSIYCHVEIILPDDLWISSRIDNGVQKSKSGHADLCVSSCDLISSNCDQIDF